MEMLPPAPSVSPMALAVIARLPLADAFYSLWDYLADAAVVGDLYERCRGRGYERDLPFADLVQVVVDALTHHHGSGRPAIHAAIQAKQLDVRQRAVYSKLSRLPLSVSETLLAELTARLRPLFPAGLRRTELPASFADFAVVVIDGKKIKRVAKRLLAVRGRPGKVYGGKLLAAYLPAEGLVPAIAADPDGEANDIRLVPRLLPLVRAAVVGPRLFVADRQFCDLDQPQRFTADGDHFLIRFSRKTGFHPDLSRPGRDGIDAAGRPFHEDWGWMGAADQGERRCYLRRIRLERPGAEPIILVTDLLDADRYPAADLLTLYLTRWQIETVFQKVTDVFELRHLIGCTPQATVFQAALCMMIYNVLETFRGFIAASRPEPEPIKWDHLSLAKIFKDLHEELVALNRVLNSRDEVTAAFTTTWTAPALRQHLADLFGRAWSDDWRKAIPKKPRTYPLRAATKQSGAHTSVHKILEEAKRLKKQPPQGSP